MENLKQERGKRKEIQERNGHLLVVSHLRHGEHRKLINKRTKNALVERVQAFVPPKIGPYPS